MPGRERLKLIENTELARKCAPSNAQEFGATMQKSCRKEGAKNPYTSGLQNLQTSLDGYGGKK